MQYQYRLYFAPTKINICFQPFNLRLIINNCLIMDGDNGAPGLLDEFFEEIRYSLELGDTTLQGMDIDLYEDEDLVLRPEGYWMIYLNKYIWY